MIPRVFSNWDLHNPKIYNFEATIQINDNKNKNMVNFSRIEGEVEIVLNPYSFLLYKTKKLIYSEKKFIYDYEKKDYKTNIVYESKTWLDESGYCIKTCDDFNGTESTLFSGNREVNELDLTISDFISFNFNFDELSNFEKVGNTKFIYSTSYASGPNNVLTHSYASEDQKRLGLTQKIQTINDEKIIFNIDFLRIDKFKDDDQSPLINDSFILNYVVPKNEIWLSLTNNYIYSTSIAMKAHISSISK